MEENEIRKYARLMQELGLTGLEVTEDGCSLRLERAPQSDCPAPAKPEAAALISGPAETVDICSPMVGVFYRAPAEDAPPYVQVGDAVRKGDVLCIIEAMKLMNEITAEQAGTVEEICVGNGQVVDFGRVLFKIRKETP